MSVIFVSESNRSLFLDFDDRNNVMDCCACYLTIGSVINRQSSKITVIKVVTVATSST